MPLDAAVHVSFSRARRAWGRLQRHRREADDHVKRAGLRPDSERAVHVADQLVRQSDSHRRDRPRSFEPAREIRLGVSLEKDFATRQRSEAKPIARGSVLAATIARRSRLVILRRMRLLHN